jgi:alpha-methylacyl-CoA racemase
VVVPPVPAPRFSRTPSARPTPPQKLGEGTRSALAAWGVGSEQIEALFARGVLGEPQKQPVPAQ